eukprot:TRINITY_DN826_c0_g1_i6.p1 TRINITY_DN826_c0_g1~~TRINITY_DN826_c0_g1_i6.p1  ORF type:complete len:565 (-),score=127.24 TRINITY_DN826_c0_g1_i6:496-2190(-)
MVTSLIGGRYSFELFEELLKELTPDDLANSFRRSPSTRDVESIFSVAIQNIPKFPLKLMKDMIGLIPLNKRWEYSGGIMSIARYGSLEQVKVLTEGLVSNDDSTLEKFMYIILAASNNDTCGEEMVLHLWRKLKTSQQKLFRMRAEAPGGTEVHETILSQLLKRNRGFSVEFFKELCDGLPHTFAFGLMRSASGEIQVTGEILWEFAPDVKKFLQEFCNVPANPYYLMHPCPIDFTDVNGYWNLKKQIIPFRRALWFNEYANPLFMRGILTDYEMFCKNFGTEVKRDPFSVYNQMYNDDSRSTFNEFLLLLYQSSTCPRKELISNLVLWYNGTTSEPSFISTTPSIRTKLVFDAMCGVLHRPLIEFFVKECRIASDQCIEEVSGGDRFYMECLKTGNFPREFFSKTLRVKTWTSIAEEKRLSGDLSGAVEFWWRAILSDKMKTVEHLRHIKLSDWQVYISQLQNQNHFKDALKCCNIALLLKQFDETSPEEQHDRYILFKTRGILHRAIGFSEEGRTDLKVCLLFIRDSPTVWCEAGLCARYEVCDALAVLGCTRMTLIKAVCV